MPRLRQVRGARRGLRGRAGIEAEPGFSLHQMSDAVPVTAERRFHVEHFRGQLGDRFYVLVDESNSSPQASR